MHAIRQDLPLDLASQNALPEPLPSGGFGMVEDRSANPESDAVLQKMVRGDVVLGPSEHAVKLCREQAKEDRPVPSLLRLEDRGTQEPLYNTN
jgi:hypothetical protein